MKYADIEKEAEQKRTALMTQCGLFWAFSNEQFTQNKTPLEPGEKYVSIGAGGYLPKGKLDAFLDGMKEISKWKKTEIKKKKELKHEHILYELNNHECFYTGDIQDAVDALPYSRAEVMDVYLKEQGNHVAV